jgi:hypothetical protein
MFSYAASPAARTPSMSQLTEIVIAYHEAGHCAGYFQTRYRFAWVEIGANLHVRVIPSERKDLLA